MALPTRMAGFGIQTPCDIATSAFLSSFVSTQQLSVLLHPQCATDSFASALDIWLNKASCAVILTDDSAKQSNWTSPVYRKKFSSLLALCNDQDKGRLLGCACIGSGDWIDNLPSSTLQLDLTIDEFCVATGYRLGAPIASTFKCVCVSFCDTDGAFALICSKIAAPFRRHNNCNILIKLLLSAAGLPSTLEPLGLLRKNGIRPDGVTLSSWK